MSTDGFSARTSRRGFLTIAGLAVGGATALSACGKKAGGGGGSSANADMKGVGNNGKVGSGRSGATGDTLLIAGFQWGPPANFSPLSPTPAWPAAGNVMQLIYETALRFNIVTGELLPGLAKEYKVDGQTITLTWQDNAKWSDGQPCTAKDFAYTWQLGKLDPSLSLAAMWVECDSIEATDDKTAVVKVNATRKNTDVVLQNIAQQYVLPQHVWEPIAKAQNNKFASYQTTKPIGSGPFPLDKADQTQVVMKLNESYWGKDFYGGLPVMKQVIHPIYKSNDDGSLQFQNGGLDVMQQFVPQIWKMWDSGKPVGTYVKDKPYYVPGSIPMFIINTTKPGLSDPAVRKAMAMAIDTASISTTAMSGYSATTVASLILPSGAESKWIDQDKAKAGWSFDKAKAEQALKDAGYAKGSDGIYAKGGVRLGPYKLITPTGWTDWNAALTIVAKNLKDVGIDASTYFPQQADCQTQIQNGTFDCCCWYVAGTSPATPWQRFSDIMSNVDMVAVGKTAFRNFGRFKNDKVNDLLATAAAAGDEASKKTALQALDDLYRENVPSIPLMYRPDEFYEYNASNFYNWPDEKNNYAPPMFRGAGNTWLYKLKKVGS